MNTKANLAGCFLTNLSWNKKSGSWFLDHGSWFMVKNIYIEATLLFKAAKSSLSIPDSFLKVSVQ